MISKVAITQPIFDYQKYEVQKPKNKLNKKNSDSFASILEKMLQSQFDKKQITC